MLQADSYLVLSREKRRSHGDVPDVAAAKQKARRQPARIHIRRYRSCGRPGALPDPLPAPLIRKRKRNRERKPAQKRLVQILAQVRRQDGYPFVLLHLLQKVRHFEVRVTVMRIPHLAALAEQRIRLVEEQNGIRIRGGRENAIQIFLRLTDVFAHHTRKINLVEIEP